MSRRISIPFSIRSGNETSRERNTRMSPHRAIQKAIQEEPEFSLKELEVIIRTSPLRRG
ncbi:hypothetical protein NOF04DRAFT_1329443 [Fusarium oxysporum II5]|nr:hypothetical protein NOF04DRAFT_1329443 [Fusarium oxysporum II5]